MRVDRCRQWLTEQVPAINAMTAYGNVLFASTTANRLSRHHTGWIDKGPSRRTGPQPPQEPEACLQ